MCWCASSLQSQSNTVQPEPLTRQASTLVRSYQFRLLDSTIRLFQYKIVKHIRCRCPGLGPGGCRRVTGVRLKSSSNPGCLGGSVTVFVCHGFKKFKWPTGPFELEKKGAPNTSIMIGHWHPGDHDHETTNPYCDNETLNRRRELAFARLRLSWCSVSTSVCCKFADTLRIFGRPV